MPRVAVKDAKGKGGGKGDSWRRGHKGSYPPCEVTRAIVRKLKMRRKLKMKKKRTGRVKKPGV